MTFESWANVARRWVSWGDVASRSRGGGLDIVCWARVGLILPPCVSGVLLFWHVTPLLDLESTTYLDHPSPWARI